MGSVRTISRGERRTIRPSPTSGLTKDQRAFAGVEVQWFNGPPLLVLVFGDLLFEMAEPLARDFGARIARAMTARTTTGSRRSFRCGTGLPRHDREFVEVLMHDDGTRTWMRLEFADGNTVDFSPVVGAEFADRIRRAMLALPSGDVRAAA